MASEALMVVLDVIPPIGGDFSISLCESSPGYVVTDSRPVGLNRQFTFVATEQIAGNATKSFAATVLLATTTDSAGQLLITAMPGGSGTPGAQRGTFRASS